MLNQIVHTGAMLLDIRNQLTHNVQLMESGEKDEVLNTPKQPETKRFLEFYGV